MFNKKFMFSDNVLCRNCNSCIAKSDALHHCKTCLHVGRPSMDYKFVCFACDYHTHLNQAMQFHIRRHTGERPYKCNYCHYSSKQPNDLKRHVKSRHFTLLQQ
uniref:Ras-responsive element-binding protein 1 n=1 Tax=Cacopsylla melanoneura TaxID=428564 RepID=A0A8D8QC33_9HEMI